MPLSLWLAMGVIAAVAVFFVIASFLGYRQRVRWYEEYDRRNPGVAEKIGVKPRGR